jgi:signal transduction histidine kinase
MELRLRASDGGWRDCELSGRRIELGGEPVMVVSGRDVTERHRLRAKLLLSDRMVSLGTLAAGIAHEINNPLAYVTANLEVVAETLGETPTVSSSEAHATAGGDATPARAPRCPQDARPGASRPRRRSARAGAARGAAAAIHS